MRKGKAVPNWETYGKVGGREERVRLYLRLAKKNVLTVGPTLILHKVLHVPNDKGKKNPVGKEKNTAST